MARYSLGDCTKCALSKCRKRICEYRGDIPADVLFIGEAPGVMEDTFGEPFIGSSGDLLDYIIHLTQKTLSAYLAVSEQKMFSFCITNTVQCIPKEDGKIRPPTLAEKQACAQRLRVYAELVKPKLIVAIGKEASNWITDTDNPITESILNLQASIINILHPAFILRKPVEEQTPLIHKSVSRMLGHLETIFLEAKV